MPSEDIGYYLGDNDGRQIIDLQIMKYDIFFPTGLDRIDPDNDNLDVLVKTENGEQYSFVVATPDNVKHLMHKDSLPYLKPGLPFLFVEKISEENIRMLLQSLFEENEHILNIYGKDV